VIYKKGGRIRS